MARNRSVAYTADPAQSAPRPEASWWARIRGYFQGRRARRDAAHALYLALVEQARQPVFYARWGVPDSRDGRLELVNLHAILVMRRLREEGVPGQELAQTLFDVMFADLDRHLREWGVGDLSVGKQVKKLAQSFFGRATALDPLLRRNVYTEAASPDPLAIRRLGAYLTEQGRWLAAQDGATILSGQVSFAIPAAEA
jgi:cytochrome b pre-mRNA-processing protein 3